MQLQRGDNDAVPRNGPSAVTKTARVFTGSGIFDNIT